MLKSYINAPFKWHGGKRNAARIIWERLGDVHHYVEPFCGSIAVLLRRPHTCNRRQRIETVNDKDGLVTNAWRAIQADPETVARYASWPVVEADLHARHLAIVQWCDDAMIERLMGDHKFCDPEIAGYWIWGVSCWISGAFASGRGPWVAGSDGRIRRKSDDSKGIVRARPYVGESGINHMGCRELGVGNYHDVVMPTTVRWLKFLSARLRHVHVLNGDWARCCTHSALNSPFLADFTVQVGIFLDPPYSPGVRAPGLYSVDSDVTREVYDWCVANGDNPAYRIALAGYASEIHENLKEYGWIEVEWFKKLRFGCARARDNKRERLWFSPHCLKPAEPLSLFDLMGEGDNENG
jgi:DNA adenine methylase